MQNDEISKWLTLPTSQSPPTLGSKFNCDFGVYLIDNIKEILPTPTNGPWVYLY